MKIKNKKNQQSGLTLIEIIITVSITVVILIVTAYLVRDIFNFNFFITSNLSNQGQARYALKTITTELRSASPSSTGTYPINSVSSTAMIFYSDIDDDGLKERLNYFLDGTTFKKGIIVPSGQPYTYNPNDETINVMITGIANGAESIFSYYDTNYDGTTDPLTEPINIPDIRLVKVTLIIDESPDRDPGPFTVTTQMTLRNLKDNL